MKPLIVFFLLAFFLVGCQHRLIVNTMPPEVNAPTACTQEAKICPDGTAVGRTEPNCEFAPCPEVTPPEQAESLPTVPDSTPEPASVVAPVAEFFSRITKKPFGIYITPQNSPVQPERFSGYHTAADIEYADVVGEVPVVAVADGTVVYSGTVNGYGGVVVIRHIINEVTYTGLYGHLDPKSNVANGTQVSAGDQIGILGDGGTAETDGERKHLHFALHRGPSVVLAGYVQSEKELAAWVDPTKIIPGDL